MRISVDIYAVTAALVFSLGQALAVAYTASNIGVIIWLTGEVCKYMLFLYILATLKFYKGDS